jgi:choline dehydrogenase-like flavoprotein
MSSIFRYGDTAGRVAVRCDAVVVGSGAGGAAVAAELAEGGLDVVVLEEGPLLNTEDYTSDTSGMITTMMRDAGTTVMFGRSPVQYVEGRCVGGTTVVNGGMCWRTPDAVLELWAREHGLVDHTPDKLRPLFERVEERINAREQDPGSEGGNSEVFRRGCESLGWQVSVNRRAQVHCVGTSDCVTGCPTGAKQSTLQSYIPHMLRHGGRLYSDAKVERILSRGGRASGVSGRLVNPATNKPDRAFDVTASIVVLACGAVQTPLLLQKNRLCRRSRQVGRNFTIHPNVKVVALFDEPVDSLHGTHQAFQCTEFQREGILLAPGAVNPPLMAMGMPGFGRDHMALMRQYRCVATGGILVDDHAAGSVRMTPFGVPLVRYDVTDQDQAKFVRGAALLAEAYFAAGARAVLPAFHGVGALESMDDVRDRLLARPPRVEDTEYFTAHLMGTCRMDARPERGVVGPTGETHEVPGLYITDASTLPTPIGVNPQETIMMMATRTAQHVLDDPRACLH